MARGRWGVVVIGALVVASGGGVATAAPAHTVRLVVELDASKAAGFDVEVSLPALGAVVVDVPADAVGASVERLRARGAGRIELDPRVEMARTPSDPLWPDQWGPQLVDVDEAWDRTTGSPATVIAVLDTGVDTSHPDLDHAVVGGIDLENDDKDFADDNGHGTQVAGIVAARGDNGRGIAGYCFTCSLLAVKVLDDEGVGDSSVVAAGIVWAVDAGASVINLSLSSPSASFLLGDAIAYAAAHDVVVVGASGNDGLLQPTYPAAYPDVIGVIASDAGDGLYRWTNRGSWAAIAAPGCHRSTRATSYADLCGTSSASPAVAGVAGLVRSAAPDASAASVRAALVSSAIPLREGNAARLSAKGAVQAILRDADAVVSARHIASGAPGAPRGVRVVTESAGEATVSWSAPEETGAAPILDYVVTTLPGGAEQTVAAPTTSLPVRGLIDGVTYRFTVAARNAYDLGPPTEPSAPVTPTARGVDRVAGAGRILTSVALSQRAFSRAPAVVLSRADQYTDALAAAPLAAQLGAPLLLSDRAGIDPAVGAEIRRLGARVAHLIGGPGALSSELEASLAWWGVTNVVRTAGADRFETAALIASEIGGREVYIANGVSGWPDAVAASGLAAAQGRPILLVAADRVPPSTRAALLELGTDAALVVGGTGSVPDELLSTIADPAGDGIGRVAVSRVAGQDRYDTSRRIADLAVSAGADPSRVWLASGVTWPDALAAAPAAAARGGVLLLIRGDDLDRSPDAAAWLRSQGPSLDEVILVGGAGSIAEGTSDQVRRALAHLRG